MKFLSCLLAFLLLAAAQSGVLAQETTAPRTAPVSTAVLPPDAPQPANVRGYLLGPGDEVEIKVMGEKDFDGVYTVDEDGKIALSFVDKPVQAGCRSEREIKADVVAALAKYLRNPSVSFRVTEKRSRPPAVVYGEVRNPQQVVLNRRVRLLELLSFSGGITEKAGGTIQVFHTQPLMCPEPGEELEPQPSADGLNMPFQVYKLSEVGAGKNEANPLIRPGDVVTVQKAAPIYVIGEVRTPPSPQDPITITEAGLTLTEAIARAGGLSREAKKKDVRIYRAVPGKKDREMISANLDSIKNKKQPDVALQAYDVVEVEKAPKSVGQFMTELLTGGVSAVTNTLPMRIIY